eukprot:7936236-Lingulodinium_polyedra.AAC.1
MQARWLTDHARSDPSFKVQRIVRPYGSELLDLRLNTSQVMATHVASRPQHSTERIMRQVPRPLQGARAQQTGQQTWRGS